MFDYFNIVVIYVFEVSKRKPKHVSMLHVISSRFLNSYKIQMCSVIGCFAFIIFWRDQSHWRVNPLTLSSGKDGVGGKLRNGLYIS
jgi:hypothetical protein